MISTCNHRRTTNFGTAHQLRIDFPTMQLFYLGPRGALYRPITSQLLSDISSCGFASGKSLRCRRRQPDFVRPLPLPIIIIIKETSTPFPLVSLLNRFSSIAFCSIPSSRVAVYDTYLFETRWFIRLFYICMFVGQIPVC